MRKQVGRVGAEHLDANRSAAPTARDTERIDHVNRIKLETNFFLAYRNTVRILLNDYANLAQRTEMEATLANTFILYSTKLDDVVAILQRIIGANVRFARDMDPATLRHASVCINNTPQQCMDMNPVCIEEESAVPGSSIACTLVIPQFNLVSPNVDNERVYINKMADQLIRYARIRAYMMDTTQFLSFGDTQFNLGEHEMIVSQTVLKNEYFTDLVPQKMGMGGQVRTYDTTNPDTTNNAANIQYVNTFSVGEVAKMTHD